MVSHQAKGVNSTVEFFYGCLQDKIKPVPVPIVEKDGITSVSAQDYMIESFGKVDSWFTSHGKSLDVNIQMSSLTPLMS